VIAGKRVLALVPARGGSKAIPRKNIAPLAGKPLIAWTIEAARASAYVDRCVISSDDEEIIAVAAQYGCDAPFRRPAEYSRDDSPAMDVLLHALSVLPDFDIVALLQPTSPLRLASDIDGCLELLLRTGAPTCVSVREARDHPFWTYTLDARGRLATFAGYPGTRPTRRQDLPRAYCLNGAVYAAQVRQLLETRTLVGKDTAAYEMPGSRSLDIDEPEDLIEAERMVDSVR
jgi:CMP-N,N'-diacetyllegionaminic acid synthase